MSEKVIDVNNMSIYKKLAYLQQDMRGVEVNSLDDMINELERLTFNYNTTLIFSFTDDAVLKLKDWKPSNGEVSIRIPLSCKFNLDEYKEWLLTNMFLITKKSSRSHGYTHGILDGKEENIETHEEKEETVDMVAPKAVSLIKDHILKKDNTLQVTSKMIYEQSRVLAKNNKIGLTAQKEVSEWYKQVDDDMIM